MKDLHPNQNSTRHSRTRPLASLSLDLDNLWSYLKTHGDSRWKSLPSYLDRFIPLALSELESLGLRITFFIVGQDADLEKNRRALSLLTENGHEVGNHSFHHEPWIGSYSRERLVSEIQESHQAIFKATGQHPFGFRGPGFSWSGDLFAVLAELGYLYDASTLPTYLGPLARLYYFFTAKLTAEEKEQRKNLFGSVRDGMRPVRPYLWDLPSGSQILEIPVTTMPILRAPFHLSYLLFLSRYSETIMESYLRLAIQLCKATGTEPSFLLHPLDLMGKDEFPELAFFPGMDLSGEQKIRLFRKTIRLLATHFQMVNMSTHARSILENGHGGMTLEYKRSSH